MKNLNKEEKCPVCERYLNRTLAIDALITKNNKILLIQRAAQPDKGKWALPGGHIDWDETIEEAVRREIKEETGLTVNSLNFYKIFSNPKRHPNQMMAVVYSINVSGNPTPGSDANEVKYFALDRLPSPLAFDHEEIIKDFVSRSTATYD